MTDTPNTKDDQDPEQSAAVVSEAQQVVSSDAAAAQEEGQISESLGRDFEDYVTQCGGGGDEGLSDDPDMLDEEFETWGEDAAQPNADLIAQTQSAIKATQAIVNAVAAKSKKKKS